MPDFLVLGALVPRLFGKPVIHDVHDIMADIYQDKFDVPEKHWIIRVLRLQVIMAAKFATHVLTADPMQKERLMSLGVPDEKITVVLNLPDESIFAPRNSLPRKSAEEPFIIVYHGTLSHRLGIDIGLRAVALLRDRIPYFKFRIIGGGEELENLMALSNELGLQDIVWFSGGYVSLEEVPKLIYDADLGVVPLRDIPATETMLPTKLMEYAFIGIPAVATKTSLILKFFDETMVRFAASEDVKSLAEAIYDLYAHSEKREQYRQTCNEKFTAKYRWAEHRKRYLDIVVRLVNTKPS
jgi:glycosyltransferase involved in cell wall biosynthesis